MIVDVYFYNQMVKNNKLIYKLQPSFLGYVEVDTFDAEKIFDLCNWSCWTNEKPENLHANIDTCGHGLLLINQDTKERWLAKSKGWLHGTEETIVNYVKEHQSSLWWE